MSWNRFAASRYPTHVQGDELTITAKEARMRMSFRVTKFVALGLVAAYAGPAGAQGRRRELVGIVRDSTGSPIEGATIDIPGGTARTDGKGAFQIWTGDIDTMTIVIRRFGYTPL